MAEDFVKPEVTVTEEELFRELVGCEEVRAKLRETQNTIRFCQANGVDPNEMCGYNFVFTGSPGTGKTTVARLMGKMFRNLGLIPCDEVVEVSASDLITGFVGQAGQKTREMLTKARGKVLFIDEAYQLKPSAAKGFMTEVVDELVRSLTSDEFKGKMIVILAGYEQPMDDMLGVNPGLRSRFSERIHFEDFSVTTVATLLGKKFFARNLAISASVASHILQAVAPCLLAAPSFANGRDAENYYRKVFGKVADRSMTAGVSVMTVERVDLDRAMQEFLKTKQGVTRNSSSSRVKKVDNDDMLDYAFQHDTAPPPPVFETTILTETVAAPEASEEEPGPSDDDQRAAGVGFGGNNNMQFLGALQDFLRAQGLETEQGVSDLAGMAMSDPRMGQYIGEIVRSLGVDRQAAVDLLLDWQSRQADVKDQIYQQKTKLAKKGRVAIWRCAICGQSDLPYIVCYVAPFISGFQEVAL
jgi:Holliday junction resolvasome RuvABC ATP-dependent DNA helicase subunit